MSDNLMPQMSGITAYYDATSIDVANGVWTDLSGSNNNMTLTGGTVDDDALKLNAGQYGLCTCGEPDVIYALIKKPTADNDRVIFDRIRSSASSDYGLSIWSETQSDHNIEFGCTSAPYVRFMVDLSAYHVFAAAYIPSANTAGQGMALIYLDGKLLGVRPNANRGQGSGLIINARKCGSNVDFGCTSATWFKAVACGSNTDSNAIVENSKWLLTGEGGGSGGGEGVTSHKNIAEAYVIGLNKGRAEALELATQAYKDGYKLGTIAHSSGGGDDVDYPADTGTIIIDNAGGEDGDGRGTDPEGNVIDMGADGIWLTFGDGAGQPRKYIHVYLDGTVDEGWYNGVYNSYKNHVKADCYDSVTGLSAELYMLTSNGNHAWYTEYSTISNGSHTYITRIKVGSNGWVFADATSYSGDYPEPNYYVNCYEICYVQYAEGYTYLGASTTAPEGVVTT